MHGPDEFIDPAGFYLAEKIAASEFVCAIIGVLAAPSDEEAIAECITRLVDDGRCWCGSTIRGGM